MATSFARKMERKTHGIAELMEDAVPTWNREVNGRSNVKPFYSPYRLFEPRPEGVERVLIGVNPGGDPKRPDTTTGPGYMDFLESSEPLNSFLDECWNGREPGKANMQIGVANVFESLYGVSGWEAALRSTATFNVCPLRTRNAGDIPIAVWEASVEWCVDLLAELRPNIIVCFAVFNKKGAPARISPWHAVSDHFDVNQKLNKEVTRPGDQLPAYLCAGEVNDVRLADTVVVGVPHLSYHHDNKLLFRALQGYGTSGPL